MIDRFRKVDNPLTIIAIFSGITEIAASVALPFLADSAQSVFVWFLFLFPFALVAAFFATLNLNPRVLYAPGDYKDETHFLAALSLSQKRPQVTVTSPDEIPAYMGGGDRKAANLCTISNLEGLTQAEVDAANAAFKAFNRRTQELFATELITGYSFGYEGEGLFILTAMLKAQVKGPDYETRIIQASTSPSGDAQLHVIGRDLTSGRPDEIAGLLFTDLRETILQRKKMEKETRVKRRTINDD
jgi:hypothetical protein